MLETMRERWGTVLVELGFGRRRREWFVATCGGYVGGRLGGVFGE